MTENITKALLIMACGKLGLATERVLAYRQTDTALIFIYDNGIAGCPKYELPLVELETPDPVEVEAAKVDTLQGKYQPKKRGRK